MCIRDRRVGSPAEVEILALDQHGLIEAAERLKEVGANHGHRAGDGEHIAHCVVLFLVVLARFGQVRHQPGLVGPESDMQDSAGLVPVEQLGPDDTGVGAQRFFDEAADAIWCERHVVVTDQQVLTQSGVLENGVRVLGEALVGQQRDDGGFGDDLVYSRRHRLLARGIDNDHFECGIVLLEQRPQDLLKPRSWVVGHDFDGHQRIYGRERVRVIARSLLEARSYGGGGIGHGGLRILTEVCRDGYPLHIARTLLVVAEQGESDADELLTELAEIAVGTAILGLRRINVERRKLAREVPELKPAIDVVLDQVEALAEPVSILVGAALSGLGDAVPGERGQQLHEAADLVAAMGPELLRLSGLTKRG